jgi:uncharacterized radical SAM superfamily Fe-S cluster-containing enzyme
MHAPHVDVGLDSRRTAHSPATQTLDFLWLELTNRCNLRCVHCYTESHPHSGDRDVLTTQDYERLMRQAYDLGCRKVQFIGGEPQLNRDFQKLLVTANTIGLSSSRSSATSLSSTRTPSATLPTTGFALPPRSIPTSPRRTTPSPG